MKTNWVKALSALLLALVLTAALAGTAFADYETGAFGIRELTTDPAAEGYNEELLENERYNFKIIRAIAPAYEAEGWNSYVSTATTTFKVLNNSKEIGEKQVAKLNTLVELRHALVPVKAEADVVWPLWGETVPLLVEESSLEFKRGNQDNADFKPFLVPYLVEDQSLAKGNLIVVAGGGYTERANTTEGYPVAEAFVAQGYNAFVLQRRVTPYGAKDIWQDMQRAVRVVRYEVEQRGLGGGDCIAATGFSGGSATVLGAIANNYGDMQPGDLDGNYVPDEIDALSSDLDVALCIYGPNYNPSHGGFTGLVSDNPHVPAMFLAVGMLDTTGAIDDNITLAQSVLDRAPLLEYHAFANTRHGFGVGTEGTNSMFWVPMAACFMQQATALKNAE